MAFFSVDDIISLIGVRRPAYERATENTYRLIILLSPIHRANETSLKNVLEAHYISQPVNTKPLRSRRGIRNDQFCLLLTPARELLTFSAKTGE